MFKSQLKIVKNCEMKGLTKDEDTEIWVLMLLIFQLIIIQKLLAKCFFLQNFLFDASEFPIGIHTIWISRKYNRKKWSK